MRRGSSSLLIILGLFLLLVAGAAGLLYVYAPAQGIFASQAVTLPPTTEPTTQIVKAMIDIEEGTLISSTDGLLKMDTVPISQFTQGVTLANFEEARNMIATSTIKAGDIVRADQLRAAGLAQKIPAPANGEQPVKAFPLQVSNLSGVADLIQPGDFIDVLASFNLDVVTIRPDGLSEENGQNKYMMMSEKSNEGISKVLLQDVQVLDIVRPAPPAEGDQEQQQQEPPQEEQAPAEGDGAQASPPPATTGNTLKTGNWIIVVAVTNQEAEVLRFSLDRGIGISTLLRRAGDHTTERTVGATMRILVDNYGMPMPSFPQVSQQPMAVTVEGATKLPPVPTDNFTPKVDNK